MRIYKSYANDTNVPRTYSHYPDYSQHSNVIRIISIAFMFSLIKFIIWVVGFVVVSGFVLNYFGYEINRNYFSESKAECLKQLDECKSKYIHEGLDNAQCSFTCVDPKLIIKKK